MSVFRGRPQKRGKSYLWRKACVIAWATGWTHSLSLATSSAPLPLVEKGCVPVPGGGFCPNAGRADRYIALIHPASGAADRASAAWLLRSIVPWNTFAGEQRRVKRCSARIIAL